MSEMEPSSIFTKEELENYPDLEMLKELWPGHHDDLIADVRGNLDYFNPEIVQKKLTEFLKTAQGDPDKLMVFFSLLTRLGYAQSSESANGEWGGIPKDYPISTRISIMRAIEEFISNK